MAPVEQERGQDQEQKPQGDGRGEHGYQSPDLHPKLTEQEQKEVEERSATPAQVVYGAIQKEGDEELARSSSALAWSGLAAGLSMGFSLVVEGLLAAMLPNEPWRPLISKLGYSVGFLIVILGRQQLFTENTLTPMLPLLSRRDRATFVNLLRLWGIVLATNLLGALIFAFVVANTTVFSAEVNRAFTEISMKPLELDFWTVLIRGVFAGWLIALMVWLLPAAETARIWVIIILTYIVGLGGLTHVIAGSVEMFYLGVREAAPWGQVIGGYIIPTLIGNVIGGVTLVAALNHAQVVSGSEKGGD